MAKAIVIVCLSLLALALAALDVVYYTPLPFRAVQSLLTKVHVDAEGFGGNLAHGPKVGRLAMSGQGGSIVLTDFELRYDDLLGMLRRHELHVRELRVGGLYMRPGSFSSSETGSKAPAEAKGKPGWPLVIDKIDVSSVSLAVPGSTEPFVLQDFRVRDVRMNQKDAGIASAELKCDAMDFALSKEPGAGETTLHSYGGRLKPPYFKRLKKPFDFGGKFDLQPNGQPGKVFEAKAFDGKASLVEKEDGSLSLVVDDLNLPDYFSDAAPIHGVKLEIDSTPRPADLARWKASEGHFFVGPEKFLVSSGPVVEAGPEKTRFVLKGNMVGGPVELRFVLTMDNKTDWTSNGNQKGPPAVPSIELVVPPQYDPNVLLARVLYGKPVPELTSQEHQDLTDVSSHITFLKQ